MGWIEDVLKEVPLSTVLKERVALADQRYEVAMRQADDLRKRVADLEQENAKLRAQIPSQESSLSADTERVLIQIFKVNYQDSDPGNMARALCMERGVVQYHLDRLVDAGLAVMGGGNYRLGHMYWALTPEGRQYIVERKLI